jgi:translation initiation factor IF-3
MKPEDLFRAEKERAVGARNSQHARLLAEAKAAFDKLMAEGQAARKSGRPRKHPLPPLKTSSSRIPPKPPTPALAAPAPAPLVVAAPPKPDVKAAPKPAPKIETKVTSKAPTPARKSVRPPKPPKPASLRGAKHALSAKREGKPAKSKAKSTKRR